MPRRVELDPDEMRRQLTSALRGEYVRRDSGRWQVGTNTKAPERRCRQILTSRGWLREDWAARRMMLTPEGAAALALLDSKAEPRRGGASNPDGSEALLGGEDGNV